MKKGKDLAFSRRSSVAHASHAETLPSQTHAAFRVSAAFLRRQSTCWAVSSEAFSASPGPDLSGML
jgi:hypothetical protein